MYTITKATIVRYKSEEITCNILHVSNQSVLKKENLSGQYKMLDHLFPASISMSKQAHGIPLLKKRAATKMQRGKKTTKETDGL